MSDAPTPPRTGSAAPAAATEALSAIDLAQLTGGRIVHDAGRPIHGGAVDSRLVRPDELFVALHGDRTDGHQFLEEAAAAGAAGLIVAVEPDADARARLGGVTIILVPDPLLALQQIAAGWRARFSPLVVGVTGSIAKTSTKEAIATVLAGLGPTLRSEGNQNNEIGLPLTLLRITSHDLHVVLEMGMYVRGEIARLAELARPSLGVVTSVLGVHLSRIGSIEAVEAAKAELVEALPDDGVVVLNADDPLVRRMAGRTRARALTYGFAADADLRAERVHSLGSEGMVFRLVAGPATGHPDSADARIPALGRLSVHNALAGAAVGTAVGMSLGSIATALRAGWMTPHRGQLLRAGNVSIVDDTYNASPASVVAALELLAGMEGRRVAVLGEMLELGDTGVAGHREVGRAAADACAVLVTVGEGAAEIAAGARLAGMQPSAIVETRDRAGALAAVLDRLVPGDVVLVKASRGAELDRLVDALVEALS